MGVAEPNLTAIGGRKATLRPRDSFVLPLIQPVPTPRGPPPEEAQWFHRIFTTASTSMPPTSPGTKHRSTRRQSRIH